MSSESSNQKEKEVLKLLQELFDFPSLTTTASELSPSQVYRCRLGEAYLESSMGDYSTCPILLLDEWLDKETSTVVQKVQPSLEALAHRGAIVVSVTHKPHLYNLSTTANNEKHLIRQVTLSRGRILSDTKG